MMILLKPKTLKKLWPAVEEVPCLTAVEAEWRSLTGAEFVHLQSFLLAEKEPAKSYPNPNPYRYLPYKVVIHGPDDIVAVCPETNELIPLRREQLVVFKLNLQALALQIASALGLKSAEPVEASTARLFRLGNLRPGRAPVSVFMLFPRDANDLERAKTAIMIARQTPFLLLTPTRQFVNGTTVMQLSSMASGVMTLADSLTVEGNKWSISEEAILTALPDQPEVEEPLDEREKVLLMAMLELKTFDDDSRRTTEDIVAAAFGPSVGYETLKSVIRGLKSRKLIETVRKKGGGCYLTERGRRRAEKLNFH